MGIPETLAVALALVTAIGVAADRLGSRRQVRAQVIATSAQAGHTEAEAESVSVTTMREVVEELRSEMEERGDRHEAEVRQLNELHEARMNALREEHDRVVRAMQRTINLLRDRVEALEAKIAGYGTAGPGG